MTELSNLSREYRIYLAVWRKAYKQKDNPIHPPVTLHASSLSTALTMIRGMYRSIKPFRTGVQFDADLSKASETFIVSLVKGPTPSDPHSLVLRPRVALFELEAELLALGLSEEDLLLSDEAQTNTELKTFLNETPNLRPANPFYKREG